MDNDDVIADEVVLYRSCPSNDKSFLSPALTVIDASAEHCMKNLIAVLCCRRPHGMLVVTRRVNSLVDDSFNATFAPKRTVDPNRVWRFQVVNDLRCIVSFLLG